MACGALLLGHRRRVCALHAIRCVAVACGRLDLQVRAPHRPTTVGDGCRSLQAICRPRISEGRSDLRSFRIGLPERCTRFSMHGVLYDVFCMSCLMLCAACCMSCGACDRSILSPPGSPSPFRRSCVTSCNRTLRCDGPALNSPLAAGSSPPPSSACLPSSNRARRAFMPTRPPPHTPQARARPARPSRRRTSRRGMRRITEPQPHRPRTSTRPTTRSAPRSAAAGPAQQPRRRRRPSTGPAHCCPR